MGPYKRLCILPNESEQQSAEKRKDWAVERTLLAKERTFSAWMRTGLSTIAVGFAIVKLLEGMGTPWIIHTAGAVLIFTSSAIQVMGFLGYRDTFRKLQEEGVEARSLWFIGFISAAVLFSSGLVVILIFFE
jgi:putative membrane protein